MTAKISRGIYFDSVVVLCALLIQAIAGSDSWCSCYTFYDDSTSWTKSRNLCQSSGGDIASIETLQEWKFIYNQTKTRTTKTSANQWWVGLQLKGGTWVWLSNSSMSYDKWKVQNIVERRVDKYILAVIDKVDGTFLKTTKSLESGTICESTGKGCLSNQTRWCRAGSHPTKRSTQTLTTGKTRPTAAASFTEAKTPTVNIISTNDSVLQVLPTTDTQGKGGSFRPQKKAFPFYVLVVVLAVIFLVCFGILIVVWICKSKKKGGHNLMQRRKTSGVKLEMALDVQNMYDQYPEDFSDQGNSASPRKNVNANDSVQSAQQVDTAVTRFRETKINSIQKNGNAVYEYTQNVVAEESKAQQSKDSCEEEKDASNDKTNAESKVVLTTFITKIEEDDEEEGDGDEDVFYSEETQQKSGPPGNSLSHENSSDMFTYATIDETDDKESNVALYAKVDDVDDNENEEQAVTYAEIGEFSANSKVPIKKPTPYYPTEYASVTVHPLSPRFSQN